MQEKAKITYLDPHLLEIPEVRITSEFEEGILEMFGDDIKKEGIEQPLLIAEFEGKHWVIDGKHRRDEALLQGLRKVPCIVREMDLKALQMRNLMSNRLRGKTKVSEEIKVVKDLFETHNVSIEELCEKTGMRRERIEELLIVSKTHHSVQEALEEEKLPLCAASQLARIKDQDAQERMLALVIQYRLKCKDVRDAVEDTIRLMAVRDDTPLPPEVPLSRPEFTISCHFCREETKIEDITSVSICKYCYANIIQIVQTARKELEEEKHTKEVPTQEEKGNSQKREEGV